MPNFHFQEIPTPAITQIIWESNASVFKKLPQAHISGSALFWKSQVISLISWGTSLREQK